MGGTKGNKGLFSLTIVAMFLGIVVVLWLHGFDFLASVSDLMFVVMIGLFASTFFIEDGKTIDVKISLPIGLTFLALFASIPLPALIFRDNAFWGFGGTLFLLLLAVCFCILFAKGTVRRGK